MYASLKPWINIPLIIKPFVKYSGTGDKVFGPDIAGDDIKCYPHSEVKVIRNKVGVEVISNTQLYVDGDVPVNELDNVIFDGDEYPVQATSGFYRDGKLDIRVVYI